MGMTFLGSKILKIDFIWDSTIVEMLGDPDKNGLTGVILKNIRSKIEKIINCDGLFVAIGHQPNSELFINKLDLDDKGYIQTDSDSTLTSIPGVFACGDIQDTKYRQAITAAGSGCMAALDAEHFIVNNPLK